MATRRVSSPDAGDQSSADSGVADDPGLVGGGGAQLPVVDFSHTLWPDTGCHDYAQWHSDLNTLFL